MDRFGRVSCWDRKKRAKIAMKDFQSSRDVSQTKSNLVPYASRPVVRNGLLASGFQLLHQVV